MFCASQASTAICKSMDQTSSCTIQLGRRSESGARKKPHLTNIINTPCSFQSPIAPKPYNKNQTRSVKTTDYLVLYKNPTRSKHTDQRKRETKKSYAKDTSDLITPYGYGSSRYLFGNRTAAAKFGMLMDSGTDIVDSHQVVVLRVSIHCKACEGKVRKHISRMAGVTSFSIDYAAKKVTVVGDVTPLGVLESLSKVKNAQLLTPAMLSSNHTS